MVGSLIFFANSTVDAAAAKPDATAPDGVTRHRTDVDPAIKTNIIRFFSKNKIKKNRKKTLKKEKTLTF